MDEVSTVRPEELRRFAGQVLTCLSVSEDDAALLADTLVAAELWGHPSHGVLRLPWYVERLRSGAMDPTAEAQVIVDTGSLVQLDGCHGIGQSLARRAVSLSTERARGHGVGAVGVRRSNHFGTAAYFTRRAAEEGFASLLFTNASPAMAPWGGTRRLIGTNPWSIAMPAGRHGVVVMDMANTAVARGKVYAARAAGREIPDTWAAGPDGLATTDPEEALAGLMLPVGGPKGYAMSFMIDLLAGGLTGAGLGDDVVGPYSPEGESRCGHLALAIDIEAMHGLESFERRAEAYIDEIVDGPAAPGTARIYAPGQLEDQSAARIAAEGIIVPPDTWWTLRSLAESTGTPLPHRTTDPGPNPAAESQKEH